MSGTEGLKLRNQVLSSEVYSESLFDGEHPEHRLYPCSIWTGLAAIQVLESVGLTMSDKW